MPPRITIWLGLGLVALAIARGAAAQSVADEGAAGETRSDAGPPNQSPAKPKADGQALTPRAVTNAPVPPPRVQKPAQKTAVETWERPDGLKLPPAPVPEPEPPPLPDRAVQHLFGLKAAAAITYGGQRPMNAAAIRAGEGIALSLGATVTPIWIHGLGLGADLDLGFKYDAEQTFPVGGFSMRRFPIILSLHTLIRIAGRYFFTLAAGPELDAGIAVARTGSLSPGGTMSNGSELGFMGEAGLRYVAGRLAAGIGFRYTAIHYGAPASADASSSGLALAVLLLW